MNPVESLCLMLNVVVSEETKHASVAEYDNSITKSALVIRKISISIIIFSFLELYIFLVTF